MSEPIKPQDTEPAQTTPPSDNAEEGTDTPKENGWASHTGRAWWAVFGLAAVLVIAYLVADVCLLKSADNKGTTDAIWTRYLAVIGGLEAIVFTAVGWVFGREVNRGAAEAATKSANDAKTDANDAKDTAKVATQSAKDANEKRIENAEAAARGRTLAIAVRQTALTASTDRARLGLANPAARSENPELEALRQMADALFPD